MAKVQAVASNPSGVPVGQLPAGRFDLAGLKASVEEAVCRAWEEEAARKREGDASMDKGTEQELKPAEMAPQQASQATDDTVVASKVSTSLDLCQGVAAKVLAVAHEKAMAMYQAATTEAKHLATEMSCIEGQIAAAQHELAKAAREAQERAEAEEEAFEEARATAQEALVPYTSAGVIAPEEAEEHLEGALAEARAQLHARRQEAEARLAALQGKLDRLQARLAELDSRRAALEARLARLRALPCIAALERARREEEARRREAAHEVIHFLETAPWHELSWQRRLTPRLVEVLALGREDPTVFEALVQRLGRELGEVDAAARPGLGWSVVRAIEALELERLFPNLGAKRAELAQAARKYHRERQGGPPMADKIVSLASRWGARVAAR